MSKSASIYQGHGGRAPDERPSRVRWVVERLVDHLPDRLIGLDTAGGAGLDELGFDPTRGGPNEVLSGYHPSRWSALWEGLRHYEVTENDVFVEFGCGKGRVVYLAARKPFGRVIGIDLSADLIHVARQNIRKKHEGLRCRNVELLVADAIHYTVPDDVTVAYMFNPFQHHIFERVIDNLLASIARRPRPITLVYLRPVMEPYVLRRGFRKVRSSTPLARFNPIELATYVHPGPEAQRATA